MPNGIEINEENFKTLGTGPQLETIFENILAIKKHVLLQPGLCAVEMDNKIKTNNKVHRRINFGIGSGSGFGAVIITKVASWLTGIG